MNDKPDVYNTQPGLALVKVMKTSQEEEGRGPKHTFV